MKKRVLITGIGGFIGSNLARSLLNKKQEVHGIWRKTTNPWRLHDIAHSINLHEVSLLDKDKLSRLLQHINPYAIVHLATYSDYRAQDKLAEMIETNIHGTANLLLASLGIPYRIFVNTGTSSEYGFKKKKMKETDLLEPVSFYAATKSSATMLCQVFANYYKKPVVTLRPFSVYGPYEEPNRFIPTIIRSVIDRREIKLTSGQQRRDFIYIKDVVDAYIRSLSKGEKLRGHIINIGTGKQHTNEEVVKTLFAAVGKNVSIHKGIYPRRIWDTPNWVADISKSKTKLSWQPRYSLEKGLTATYNWLTTQHTK